MNPLTPTHLDAITARTQSAAAPEPARQLLLRQTKTQPVKAGRHISSTLRQSSQRLLHLLLAEAILEQSVVQCCVVLLQLLGGAAGCC